ncbi:MAG: magnesium transporter CorA family protein [Candidatus Aenigmarchaeota archaeon]|nr:magnesium transporter CorA family protein [Candidatus Aenigmarchaeota archaeon]
MRDEVIRRVSDYEVGCWISVADPTKAEIDYLVKKFNLDEQNLLSGIDQNEIPRVDFAKEGIYIFVKTVLPNRNLQTFLILITNNFILTLSKSEPSFFEKIRSGEIKFVTTQKLKSLITLLSLMNKEFERTTMEIVKMVNARKAMFRDLTESEVNSLLSQEILLNNLLSSYHYLNLVYERLLSKVKFFEKDKEIVEDLIVEANQGFNLCKSSLKTISNIRNYYLIILSNKLNKILTILTIFTILISIPAAVSGIYGMNILLPLQKNPLAFWYIMFFISLIWIGFILYLRKIKLF